MFNSKKHHYEIELMKHQNRIHELEEILCPCSQHEFVLLNQYMSCDGFGEIYTNRVIQCRRCKKITQDDDSIAFRYKLEGE